MEVLFMGVRGSYPVPGQSTVRYGGNTTCVAISKQVQGKTIRLIVDSGTGIVKLGNIIIKNFFAGTEDLTKAIFFTHLHPDHTQGFPFFAPNFFPQAAFHLFGMETLKKHIGGVLEGTMVPPTFPIEYKDLKSKRTHYKVRDGQVFFVDGFGAPREKDDFSGEKRGIADAQFKVQVMQSYAPSHPQQGCVYYRFTDLEDGKSVTCCWDLESHSGGDKRVIAFAKDTDLLIHDTQYTEEEYTDSRVVVQGFGHSTYGMAIENAVQANAKQLVCMHFNPSHTDEKLDAIQAGLLGSAVKVTLAKEGDLIVV